VATFFQGVALGAYIQGFPVVDRSYAGGTLDWFSAFSVFTGLGLVTAFALLGSTWLIIKTEGQLQQHAYRLTKRLAWALLAVISIISAWTPLLDAAIAQRWFSMPNLLFFAPVPILVAMATYALVRAVNRQRQVSPFLCTLALVFLGYSGLGISLWPNIIPPAVSVWDASAPPQSQGFALVGALLIIPVILMYTVWSYYVFRGKVKHGEGYH
jgi:cytochrome d ubiquinol oxidase subunit II